MEIPFDKNWIINGVDSKTVEFAETLGKSLAQRRLSTSQIRNVFGEIKRIQLKGFEKEKTSFFLLKPKMAYAASRNNSEAIKALKVAFDEAHTYVTTEATYKNFVDFFEAILAYHKAYGGN